MSAPGFHVERVLGLATLQDLGHHGLMHVAVPPGGALVPELLVAANRRVGNPDDSVCIEVQGRLVIRAAYDTEYAIDDQPRCHWRAEQTIEVSSGARRCAYLAVRGGFLGGLSAGGNRRGSLLCAGDPPIATGDVLLSAKALMTLPPSPSLPSSSSSQLVGGDTVSSIAIIAGPDLGAFADDALVILASAPYRILPASNRVGTRLAGPALPRRPEYRERSRPMVSGALEVPRDGQPIVLGPEHPTTGGYPVIGVIASAELGRFHAIRLGGSVRFSVRASVTSSR